MVRIDILADNNKVYTLSNRYFWIDDAGGSIGYSDLNEAIREQLPSGTKIKEYRVVIEDPKHYTSV